MPSVGLTACLLWGAAATYCFFEAWMAFVELIACAIGIIRNGRKFHRLLGIVYQRFSRLLLFSLGLILLFAVFWVKMGLGRSPSETLAFLITASLMMLIVVPSVKSRIDKIWMDITQKE